MDNDITIGRYSGQKFDCVWIMRNDSLFLKEIRHGKENAQTKYPKEEIINPMEKFTGSKFDKNGMMFANWVNNNIYIILPFPGYSEKIKRMHEEKTTFEEISEAQGKEETNWVEKNGNEIIFKNGVAISIGNIKIKPTFR